MRSVVWAMVLLVGLAGEAAARNTLFGSTSGGETIQPATPPADAGADTARTVEEPSKDDGSRQRDGAKGKGGQGRGQGQGQGHKGRRDGGGSDKPDAAAEPPAEDVGVIVRPVRMDDGLEVRERMDFRLSRIDKPLAHETTAAFREGWALFRSQNGLSDDGGFIRRPQLALPVKARLLQDLGDGRWFAEAEWANPGAFAWCPAGANADKAVVVLGEGEGKVGETLSLNAVHVGLVELRFDCSVEPAAGRRITLRRHAFLAAPALPDDEATRQRFQQAVAAGKAAEVVMVQVRDCKACGGVGYIRRSVPGRIQDAHDPCPGGCEKGDQRVPVLVTFRP